MRITNRQAEDWPSDMVISVKPREYHILLLLYIRAAWGLTVCPEIPNLDPTPRTGKSAAPATTAVSTWERRWERGWRRAWQWYQIEDVTRQRPTPELLQRLARPGQELHPSYPPMWSNEHGMEGIDLESYERWITDIHHTNLASPTHRHSLANQPEHVCLRELKEAWRTGLDTILCLPYKGDFACRFTERHLAVSLSTRRDEGAYRRALQMRAS